MRPPPKGATECALIRFRFIVGLAARRGRDDWASILAAIPQDHAARIASRVEHLQGGAS